jgi:hypothetical protein
MGNEGAQLARVEAIQNAVEVEVDQADSRGEVRHLEHRCFGIAALLLRIVLPAILHLFRNHGANSADYRHQNHHWNYLSDGVPVLNLLWVECDGGHAYKAVEFGGVYL